MSLAAVFSSSVWRLAASARSFKSSIWSITGMPEAVPPSPSVTPRPRPSVSLSGKNEPPRSPDAKPPPFSILLIRSCSCRTRTSCPCTSSFNRSYSFPPFRYSARTRPFSSPSTSATCVICAGVDRDACRICSTFFHEFHSVTRFFRVCWYRASAHCRIRYKSCGLFAPAKYKSTSTSVRSGKTVCATFFSRRELVSSRDFWLFSSLRFSSCKASREMRPWCSLSTICSMSSRFFELRCSNCRYKSRTRGVLRIRRREETGIVNGSAALASSWLCKVFAAIPGKRSSTRFRRTSSPNASTTSTPTLRPRPTSSSAGWFAVSWVRNVGSQAVLAGSCSCSSRSDAWNKSPNSRAWSARTKSSCRLSTK
mmetsp:Transcript_21190/g.53395  ORF Transcript_21190/g.53395 Transcript_21190/m.53395 type:complete len:367 (-) Transcript_21190:846-1946(-)